MAFGGVAWIFLSIPGVHWCTIKYSSEDGRIDCFGTSLASIYTNFLSKLHRYAQSMISGYVGEEKASLNLHRQNPQTSPST